MGVELKSHGVQFTVQVQQYTVRNLINGEGYAVEGRGDTDG